MFWRARVDRSPPSSSPSRLPSRVRRATSLLVRGHRRHDVLRPVESTTSFGARVAPSEPELRPSPPRARARAQSHASSRHPAPRPRVRHPPLEATPRVGPRARGGSAPGNPSPTPESASDVRRGTARGCTSRDPICTRAIRCEPRAIRCEPRATQSYSRGATRPNHPRPRRPSRVRVPRDDPRRGGVRLVATPRRIRSREGLTRKPRRDGVRASVRSRTRVSARARAGKIIRERV